MSFIPIVGLYLANPNPNSNSNSNPNPNYIYILTGVTPTKVDDAKCLHAHVGDLFLRGENKIGEYTLRMLRSRGIESDGCENCWQQCSSNVPREESMYWYMSRKSKVKSNTIHIGT